MILDTSAPMALLLEEPDQGNWIELAIVTTRRNRPQLFNALERVRAAFPFKIEPVTVDQSEIGIAAYRRYDQGSGHRARLNCGDCFAYALAKAAGEPLLFKGDDFIHTDIVPAV